MHHGVKVFLGSAASFIIAGVLFGRDDLLHGAFVYDDAGSVTGKASIAQGAS
jgi:hypothetical protein